MKKCKTLLLVLVAMLLVGCGGKTEKEKQLAEMINQEQMLLQEQKEQEKENEPVDYEDIEDQAELYSVLNKAVNSYPSVEIEHTMTNLEFRNYLKNVFKGDLVAYKVFLSTSEYSNNRVEVDYKDAIEYDEDWEDSFVIYEIIDDKDAKSNRSNYVGIGLDPVNTVYYIDDIALSADKPNTILKIYF